MICIALIIAFFVVCLDQLFKLLVINNLKFNNNIVVINQFLKFTYVENKGAAFGILQNQRWLFILTTIVVIIAIIYLILNGKVSNKLLVCSLGLIIGGGVGNLIDRILNGYVVDYISISFFPPIFNFADCAVCIGSIFLIIYILFYDNKTKVKKE